MLLSNLLYIFYPRTCVACAGYIKSGLFCEKCLRALPRTEHADVRGNIAEMALEGVKNLDKAGAFLFFDKEHPIQRVIHRMKYADQPEIGYALGRQAAMEWQYADFFGEIDVIMPIPLHPKRLRERGYNQAEYIARGISEITGIPVDTTHLKRVRNTPKQAMLEGEERVKNVASAFEVNHPEELADQHILLVDDLITTGETMKACIKAMRPVKGAKYTVFALCKAR